MIRVSCRKPTMRYLLTGFAVVLLGFTTAQSQQRKPAKPAPAKRPSSQQKAPQPATGISPGDPDGPGSHFGKFHARSSVVHCFGYACRQEYAITGA
ncbi:MAG: hypothetical protein IPG76_23185 [Acidobacteria bacterium]|nr:hypothetical protein [Acidobacteriota bacterium]